MKQKTAIILTVLALPCLIGISVSANWAWRYYTAEIRGTVDAEEQIESAESRIQNYEWFYNMYHSVQAKRQQVEIQKNRMESALEQDADSRELSRIRSNIAGLESVIATDIERYNARARQENTAARFRASDLPYEMDY